MPNAFVDSNVLVYAAEEKMPPTRKTTIARELLLQPGLHFSVQVLSEFVVNARHPQKLNLPREMEQRWLQGWLLRPVANITTATFLRALAIHTRYQISHWDSLILAAASEMNCPLVYSEDLNHGQVYDGVKVINPFLKAPAKAPATFQHILVVRYGPALQHQSPGSIPALTAV